MTACYAWEDWEDDAGPQKLLVTPPLHVRLDFQSCVHERQVFVDVTFIFLSFVDAHRVATCTSAVSTIGIAQIPQHS